MKKITFAILISTILATVAAVAQPFKFDSALVFPINDTAIEGITYQRKVEYTQLQDNYPSKQLVVRAKLTTYRGETTFFTNASNSRLYADVEIIADNSSMVDSLGNIIMTYTEYVEQHFDTTTNSWKPNAPRYWKEYEWYQFLKYNIPIVLNDAIRAAIYRWALRRGFVNVKK